MPASQVQRQDKVGQPWSHNKQVASISFYPGAARGAWKHAPIIPLPRCTALLRAQPPKNFRSTKSIPMQLVLLTSQTEW